MSENRETFFRPNFFFQTFSPTFFSKLFPQLFFQTFSPTFFSSSFFDMSFFARNVGASTSREPQRRTVYLAAAALARRSVSTPTTPLCCKRLARKFFCSQRAAVYSFAAFGPLLQRIRSQVHGFANNSARLRRLVRRCAFGAGTTASPPPDHFSNESDRKCTASPSCSSLRLRRRHVSVSCAMSSLFLRMRAPALRAGVSSCFAIQVHSMPLTCDARSATPCSSLLSLCQTPATARQQRFHQLAKPWRVGLARALRALEKFC
jgi:hypothetical protein